jgi:hypothetical protein
MLCVGVAWSWNTAEALQYKRLQLEAPSVLIVAQGPIVLGDAARLTTFVQSLPPGDRVIGFAVDSPGGTIVEAGQIADLINKRGLSVAVPSESQCASACFILFAAAPRRFAGPDALIGVHGANDVGKDDWNSMAVTTVVARALREYGVPPAIIGKMVTTEPNRMEWLTPEDLASMGVTILADDTQSPTPPDAPASPPSPAPAVPEQPPPAINQPPPVPSGPEKWAAYGEWIQAASRDNAPEAVRLATDIHRQVPNVMIFTADGGWLS